MTTRQNTLNNSETKKVFQEYVEKYRTKSASDYNFSSLNPAAKYNIPEAQLETFFHYYQKLIFSGKKGVARTTFAERPEIYAPLRFDFDLNQKDGKRLYKQSDIDKVVKKAFSIIKETIDPSFDEKQICILLEKPAPRIDEKKSTDKIKIYKDGFHLHFNVIVDTWTDSYIKKVFDNWFMVSNPFQNYEYTKIENDRDIPSKTWLLYGSAKSPGEVYYKVTCVYSDEDGLSQVELKDAFDHKKIGKNPIEFYLPSLLSIRGHLSPAPLCTKVLLEKEKSRVSTKKIERKNVSERDDVKIAQDIKEIIDAKYIEHLSQNRADDYKMWIDVGLTLYGISGGSQEGLDLWIEFSKRSEKFQEGECERRWEKFTPNKRTMGSLIYMLQADDPEYIKEYRKQRWEHLFRDSVSKDPTHRDVAVIIYQMKKNTFVYATKNGKNLGNWYTFGKHTNWVNINAQTHHWKKMHGERELRLYIMEELMTLYKEYKEVLVKEKKEKHIEEGQDVVMSQIYKSGNIPNVTKMISKLGDEPFVTKVIKTCQVYFMDEEFETKKDMNKWLIGCENGVLDLEAGVFRDGRPDDYITLSTKLYFDPKINSLDEEALDNILGKIFVDEEHRDYMLLLCSACLFGKNLMKNIPCHIGPTNAGKSVILSLMRLAFGEYCKEMKKERVVVGTTKSSGGPEVEIKRLRGARVVIVPELEKRDQLDIAFIKTLTSALDKLYTRGMHDDEGEDMEITFTTIFQLNDFPKVPGEDEAFWGRVMCIPYLSHFIKPQKLKDFPVNPDPKKQYKERRFRADLSLEEKLKPLANVFLAKLFKIWNDSVSKYEKNPQIMEPPEYFTKVNDQQRSRFDTVSSFMKDCLKIDKSVNVTPLKKNERREHFTETKALFADYQEWYRINFPSYKCASNLLDFSDSLSKKTGIREGLYNKTRGFYGIYRIKELPIEDDDENENDQD